jgi:Protein of unknown function (DUF1153)
MRWTVRRKAEVVVAIAQGRITIAEAKERHGLSEEELAAWQRDYTAHGEAGLRATWLQQYRRGGHPRRGRRITHADGGRLADLPIPGLPPGGDLVS